MAKIFNLWSVHKNFATFWNREIEPQIYKNPQPQYIESMFEKVLMQMYVMFNCNDFKYCSSTPTLEAYGNPLMINNRKKLIQRYEQEI